MTKVSIDVFVDSLNDIIDREIKDLNDICSILTDEKTLGVDNEMKSDIETFKQKAQMLKNTKTMIAKAAIGTEHNDSSLIMNMEEKKIFIRLVKIIYFIRKIFKIRG